VKMVTYIVNRMLSFIFPDRCFVCDAVLSFCKDGVCLCEKCRKRLTFLNDNNTCRICGRPVDEGQIHCETCQTHRHEFDKAFSALQYTGAVREAVLRYKFGGRRDYSRSFAGLMYRRMQSHVREGEIDAVVCVPLSAERYRERGYNQSALLAGILARYFRAPFLRNAFKKVRETAKQSTLHYLERKENVHRAYSLILPASAVRKKHILLVDDVITTSATADELARLLKRAGASKVTVVTIASPERNRLEKLPQPDLDEDEF